MLIRRFWLGLAVCMSLVLAQSAKDLDAPVSAEVADFTQKSVALMHAGSDFQSVKPYVPQAGWPTVSGAGWWFQYPPDWLLRGNGPTYAWVSDSRDVAHVLLVTLDEVPGYLDMNDLFGIVFNKALASRAASSEVRVLASDWANPLGPYAGSSSAGVTQIWVFRWLDQQAGLMLATLQITLYAQGLSTSFAWNLTSCPEAEIVATAAYAFGPISLSFYAPPPGGSEHESDYDNDGYPDAVDNHPDDPAQH